MSNQSSDKSIDVDSPQATEFDLVREGARLDGVEIVHYKPRFDPSAPKSKVEKRIERTIALCFLVTGVASLLFVGIYGFWDWRYAHGSGPDKWFTPLLGTTMGFALLGIGFGVLIWAKKLLPAEVAIQDRHDGGSTEVDKKLTVAALSNMVTETGIKRRPLLKGALALGMLPAGLLAIAPLGAMIKKPHGMFDTGFKKGVRLVRLNGSAIRPDDISAGGIETVFPGIPGGATNKYADSPHSTH
jgi:ubiquinol-cytochrome c reductase iron-sulfur subunit